MFTLMYGDSKFGSDTLTFDTKAMLSAYWVARNIDLSATGCIHRWDVEHHPSA
jgi:hypothetical protein